MIIKFKVYNQIIQKDHTSHIISDSQKYLYFAFEFTEDWNGASKFVQMARDDDFYELQLDSTNQVQVPWELLVGSGKITVSLFGSKTGGVLITTNSITVNVEQTGIVEDEQSLVPTENSATAILNQVTAQATIATTKAGEASASANSASDSATSASNSATSASGSATTATTQAGIATTKASEASASASSASTSASNASTSESNASSSASSASSSASSALSSKNAAKTSETNASTYATNANASKVSAGEYATQALAYKNAAQTSATNAATSESNASTSASNANTAYQNTVSALSNVYTKSEVDTLSNGKVSKAGDTMSGNLTISKNTQAECIVKNTNNNASVSVVAGESGARGLYDTVNSKWIIYSPNGATTTNLPSNPASTDNSTQIATTNYVKSNLSSYVAKSGDTMTGALNINSNSNIPLVIKNPDIEYGVSPSSTKTTYFRMCDKSANPITELISQRTTTGATITYIRTNGQGSGSGYAEIRLTRTANGETTTSAPTPSTTDNSTQIATTSYVKNQFTYKDFAFSSISYTAGTIGTRGYQSSSSVTLSGYTPVSATIISISDSSSIIPITFIQTSSNLLYLNCYRTTTSAVSSNSVTVRVLYKSN